MAVPPLNCSGGGQFSGGDSPPLKLLRGGTVPYSPPLYPLLCMTYVYSILSIFMQNAWWTKQSYKEKSLKNMKKKYALVMSPCAAPSIVKMRSSRSAGGIQMLLVSVHLQQPDLQLLEQVPVPSRPIDDALNLGAHLGCEVVHKQVEFEPPISDVAL